jgi:hypothetical protein
MEGKPMKCIKFFVLNKKGKMVLKIIRTSNEEAYYRVTTDRQRSLPDNTQYCSKEEWKKAGRIWG